MSTTGKPSAGKAKMSDRADLVADFAHELRTPLGGIDAIADLLLIGATSLEQRKLIHALKAASDHLRAVASHVIDGEDKIDGLMDIHTVELTFGAFLDMIGPAFAARADARNTHFAIETALGRSTLIDIDPVRIRQMLENLIDNAFKVNPEGAVVLVIDAIATDLVFHVRDEGPGFSKKDLERLFERRMQTEEGPSGAGIGLSLVKRYVEQLHGTCGGLNLKTRGADIWFRLPNVVRLAEDDDRGPRALVIEDSYAGRLLMRTMLEHFGFQVELAIGATSAVEAIEKGAFDLITVDKMLGDSDGIAVTRILRDRLGKEQKAKIVAVTGRVDDQDRAEFMLAGADAFLPKPLSPRAMADVLSRLGFKLGDSARAA
jgi:two-component system, sensor histidine kinase